MDANPGAHAYNLYFNGNFIGSSSSGLLNISVKEDGEYTCVPVNKLGIGSNGSVSLNVVEIVTNPKDPSVEDRRENNSIL